MKRAFAIAAVGFMGTVLASPAQASDSCETFICMAGKVAGSGGGSSCAPSVSDFFSIVVYGSYGQMLTGQTADKRRDHLNSCQGADPEMVSSIISEFGRTAGL